MVASYWTRADSDRWTVSFVSVTATANIRQWRQRRRRTRARLTRYFIAALPAFGIGGETLKPPLPPVVPLPPLTTTTSPTESTSPCVFTAPRNKNKTPNGFCDYGGSGDFVISQVLASDVFPSFSPATPPDVVWPYFLLRSVPERLAPIIICPPRINSGCYTR